jgi:hypothetical protein
VTWENAAATSTTLSDESVVLGEQEDLVTTPCGGTVIVVPFDSLSAALVTAGIDVSVGLVGISDRYIGGAAAASVPGIATPVAQSTFQPSGSRFAATATSVCASPATLNTV